jgi:oligo-1,6-glucosidase/alpha-glucosidase
MPAKSPWWQTTTIYQIYPRSFADSNDDGIGDLPGIISKLDYIQDLGFETIWVSPFLCSPQQDFGYDVSDYCDIAPEYGRLADAEELIRAVHQRGMRVLFDLVLNHTSIQHPWFQESRSSRSNSKRDWYIWRDGRANGPPNNWKAIPGGSGWHYDKKTDQWFYTSFLPFQPDLNWRNPALKQAMFDMVRFWLEKGVDGFRLDIFHSIYKDAQFRDNPFSWHFLPQNDEAGFFQEWKYSLNQPEVLDLARDLRALVKPYSPERMLVGEVFGSEEKQKQFLGENQEGLNLVFLWELLKLKTTAAFLREVIQHYEQIYPAPYTPVYVFGNHDRKRLISQCGGDLRIAKLLAMFQFTVRGIPVTYYGEEIGMSEVSMPAKTALDPIGRKYAWVPSLLADMLGLYVNRDGCRTPMQWEASPNAGFSAVSATPWLPVHQNHAVINVQDQLADQDSLLNLYRALLRLRNETHSLQTGRLELIGDPDTNKYILAYTRSGEDQTLLVALNFGTADAVFHNPTDCQQILLRTGQVTTAEPSQILLPPYSGVLMSN